ncbi:MAG: nitrile hydratase subunit beta [Candidatus Rokuibacteriota bacterium]
MDGIHDLGGRHGFGPIEADPDERGFHAWWEAHVVACVYAGIHWPLYTIDEFRHSRERLPPVHYLEASYFEQWLDSACQLLVEKGVVTGEELEARIQFFADHPDRAVGEAITTREPPPREGVAMPSFRRTLRAGPRFGVGDRVVTRNLHPPGHTRLPGYARGKRGVVAAARGPWVCADTSAPRLGDAPEHLYSVRFDADELWGSSAEPRAAVHLDLWESYLDPA